MTFTFGLGYGTWLGWRFAKADNKINDDLTNFTESARVVSGLARRHAG
ncbi:hypothetical protein [Mycobacterium sp. AZCC_0083]|nr:hypothetical protein [Mycobacterium sp. AZCC_0083]MBB5163480.1 hypothetical protein [Mycobacterium sp. AZCC_0083]